MKSIFRKASLEKLSSPEQLDKLVQLTSPRSWMGILFFLIIIFSMIIWGVLGTIPKKYQGQGVMMSSGGTVSIQSKTNGIISDITIEQGDFVYKGQVIARIDRSQVIEEIEKMENQLNQLKEKNEMQYMSKINDQSLEIEKQSGEIVKQTIELEDLFLDKEKAIKDLLQSDEDVLSKEKLFNAGAISKEVYEDSIKENNQYLRNRDRAIVLYEQAKKNKSYLEISLLQLESTKDALEEEFSKNPDEETLIRNIGEYKDKLEQGDIFSTVDGKVLKVDVHKYNLVQMGMSVATVLEKGIDVNETSILFYLPIEQGKRIVPGMKVNVYPTTLNRQEYGHMKAVITKVSEYAIAIDEIKETLGNDELANKFMQMGVLVEINANLLKDENSKSGFYWSGRKGRTVEINEGTICDVSVTIEENRPISLVIPLLKEKLLP